MTSEEIVYTPGMKDLFKELISNKSGLLGLIIILVFVFMAIFAPHIAISDPLKIGKPHEILLPPSPDHPLGTDDLGRDIWSQIVYGARVSLLVGFLATIICVGIGTIIGLTSGFFGGKVDEILMRITDMVMVIPGLPLMIVLSAVLGPSIWNIIFVISVISWPYSARVIRSQVLSVKERPFVEAARCLGASDIYLMFREILPNVVPIVLAEAILYVSSAIYSEAVLSFLGLGDPFHISWGMMLHFAFSSGALAYAWWWALSPGIAIALLILGFTFLGSAVNDIINPRLKER